MDFNYHELRSHSKYPNYKSYLIPLLTWNEIETQILNTYNDIVITHNKTTYDESFNDYKEIDDIIKEQIKHYSNSLSYQDLKNTLKFIFEQYKEFLYFRIRKGKLNICCHIYNREYTNNIYKKLRTFNNKPFYKFYTDAKKELRSKRAPFLPPHKWYYNNCIVRMENWGDESGMPTSYVKEIVEMLELTCEKYNVPDCDFILNRKDFQFLTLDKSCAYFSLCDSNEKTTQPDKVWFVCSQSKRSINYDITIPDADTWTFLKKLSNNEITNINTDWSSKVSRAIFRGSSTGCGITSETNPRLKIATISDKLKKQNINYLDVGIVKFVKGFKINNKTISYLNPKNLSIKTSNFVSYDEQSNYKYLLNIEGNAQAYRLASLFYPKSVVICIDSIFKMWYEPLLKHKVNSIIINKDFVEKDITKTIESLIKHDDLAEIIASNGRKFFDKYINEDTICLYWYKLLCEFNKRQV